MIISKNFQRKISEPEISYGRGLYFFLITDKKTRVGGGEVGRGDIGSVGLVETLVLFFTPLALHQTDSL